MKDDLQPCVQGHCPGSKASVLLQKSVPGCMEKVKRGAVAEDTWKRSTLSP